MAQTPNMRSLVFPEVVGQTLNFISGEIRRTPSNVNIYALTANTAVNVTFPAGTEWALFNASNQAGTAQIPYYVCDAAVATAALPTGNVTNGTGVEFMPVQYNVRLNSTNGLSVIANTAGYLYVSLYSNPGNSTGL